VMSWGITPIAPRPVARRSATKPVCRTSPSDSAARPRTEI
jgi:hypothetical protein